MSDLPEFRCEPIVLEGRSVRLEPLEARHAASLFNCADQETWAYMFDKPTPWSVAGFERYVEDRNRSGLVPFAVIDKQSGEAVGSSSYLDIRPEHRALEIGHTWIADRLRGTAFNPEMKLLMMQHAFDALGAVRVQLKTDERNKRSQAAMLKMGAQREGAFRNHMILPDGHLRTTVFFSVTREDWPKVKAGLEQRLQNIWAKS